MKSRLIVFLILCMMLMTTAAMAQEEKPVEMGDIVVTATKVPQLAQDTASAVTVITGDQIRDRHVDDLAPILQTVAGLDLEAYGPLGNTVSISMRGSQADQVLVLVDGVEINDAYYSMPNLTDLMPEDVERIEIVKGPYSSLYGPQAMGGVINIITRKGGGKPRLSLRAEIGGDRTYVETLRYDGSSGPSDWAFTLSQTDTANILNHDGYSNGTLTANLETKPSDRVSLSATIRYFDKTKDVSTSFPNYFWTVAPWTGRIVEDQNAEMKERNLLAALGADFKSSKRFEWSLKASIQDVNNSYNDPPDTGVAYIPDEYHTKTKTRKLNLQSQFNWFLSGGSMIVAGVDYKQDEVKLSDWNSANSFFDWPDALPSGTLEYYSVNKGVSNIGLFLQAILEPRTRWLLTLGLRYDDHSKYDPELHPRISLAVDVNKYSRVRMSWGTAFAAPTLLDLYHPVSGVSTLRPEKSQNFEVGLEQNWDKFFWSVTYFQTDFDDLIDFRNVAPFISDNYSKAHVNGLEWEVKWRPNPKFSLEAGYSTLDTVKRKPLTADAPIAGRPKTKGSITLNWIMAPGWSTSLTLRNVGAVPDKFDFVNLEGNMQTGDNPSYTVVDWVLNARLNSRNRAFIKIANVADQRYMQKKGYPGSDRTLRAGWEITF